MAKKLSPRQRKLISEIPKSKTFAEAMRKAKYSNTTIESESKRTINNLGGSFQEALAKKGIDDDSIVDRLIDGLNAYKVDRAQYKGTFTDERKDPDFNSIRETIKLIKILLGDIDDAPKITVKTRMDLTGLTTDELIAFKSLMQKVRVIREDENA